ncbi:MAG: single-stranded-DNA-specific exonuclease RecJ [Alphaproteobacteria bacterium]|nr:single-stranded-DNA-specific exonuclease RecJ [Alphaproteobacteria bacterium]
MEPANLCLENDAALSLNKARWVFPDAPMAQVEQIARRFDLPEIVARLLVVRGVAMEDVEGFLHPTLREHFPDPYLMAGMEALAGYAARAIADERKIAIFGDFDVDGATSSALLHRFLKHCGVEAPIYIPGRLTEGYGPNEQALLSLKDQGAEIVFLLDCGTTAFETVAAGKAMGLEIVILDHHEVEERLPEAAHVVNPKRRNDVSGLSMLAAVGVTFMACVAINKKLREAGFYEGREGGEAPLKEWLDLVALGTVCDMVPLTGVNRLLVRTGFEVMQRTGNPGLRALIKVSGINGAVEPYHAGFVLGPRINAGSRVHKSELGAQMLATDDIETAENIAWTLNDCNDKRKEIQAEMEAVAIAAVDGAGIEDTPLIFVEHKNFHQGLSGLVAGRLKEKYGLPVCVVSYAENAEGVLEGRGSGRSIPGVHIAQAFIDARHAGLIEKGGGHAMAGGFTVMSDKMAAFRDFLFDHIRGQMNDGGVHVETQIDALITVRGARPDFIKMIHDYVGPFGQDFPEPLFCLQNVRIHSADIVGEAHIRLQVSDWEGGSRMKAMAFRAVGTPLGEALLNARGQGMNLLGHLKVDNWGGYEKTEMHIKDAFLLVKGV